MMIQTSSQLSFAFWTFAGFYLYWIWAENNSTFGFETIINHEMSIRAQEHHEYLGES